MKQMETLRHLHRARVVAISLALAVVAGALGACKSDGAERDGTVGGKRQNQSSADAPRPALVMLDDAPRAITHEGRIFLIGTVAGLATFEAERLLPYNKAMIGEGPLGETVVVEATPYESGLADRLWAEWSAENVFYIERRRDGRIYVMGTKASVEAFDKGGDLVYTRSLIGVGPNGETVIVEVDPLNPGFVERLQTQFQLQHPVKR